jgi:hypothetical protein
MSLQYTIIFGRSEIKKVRWYKFNNKSYVSLQQWPSNAFNEAYKSKHKTRHLFMTESILLIIGWSSIMDVGKTWGL